MNFTGRENYKELQKIHFDGECSEDESIKSDQSSFSDQFRPPPLSVHELMGNLVVVDRSNHKKKTDSVLGSSISSVVSNKNMPNRSSDVTANWFPDVSSYPPKLKQLIQNKNCLLCKVNLSNQVDIKNHYQGARHNTNLTLWFKNNQQLSSPKQNTLNASKSFNFSLTDFPELQSTIPGASSIKSKSQVKDLVPSEYHDHYTGLPDSKKKNYSVKSNASNSQNTSVNLETNLYLENEDALEQEVLSEIKKLVNALYFSKEVPLEKALEFLNKFNKEVEDSTNASSRLLRIRQLDYDLENSSELKSAQTQENKCFMPYFFKDDNAKDPPEDLNANSCLEPADTKEIMNNIDVPNVTKVPEERKNAVLNKSLVDDFINKKISISQIVDKDSPLEVEVLSEMVKLIDSVYSNRKVPIVRALSYLEKFNKEVDEFISEKNKFPDWY